MVGAINQLTLDLGHRTASGREDFLVAASNRDAVAWVDLWPEWPSPALILHGPPASGKSHLAAFWAERAQAMRVEPSHLGDADPHALMASGGRLVIDVIDGIVGHRAAETTLFHLFNLARENRLAGGRASLLLIAETAPIRLDFTIADLASRLRGAPAVGIQPPDDALLAAILVKLFNDRQLSVGQDVLHYLIPRIERSFAAARDAVARLDASAMAQHRAISVPFARDTLFRNDAGLG